MLVYQRVSDVGFVHSFALVYSDVPTVYVLQEIAANIPHKTVATNNAWDLKLQSLSIPCSVFL